MQRNTMTFLSFVIIGVLFATGISAQETETARWLSDVFGEQLNRIRQTGISPEMVLLDDSVIESDTGAAVVITQSGEQNQVHLDQQTILSAGVDTGLSDISAGATAADNTAISIQAGSYNDATIFQQGFGNTAIQIQAGNFNTTLIEQYGISNFVQSGQFGSNNDMHLIQEGAGLIHVRQQFGAGHSYFLYQSNATPVISITQTNQ